MKAIQDSDFRHMVGLNVLNQALRSKMTAGLIYKLIIREIGKEAEEYSHISLYRERLYMLENLAMEIARGFSEGRISRHYLVRLFDVFFAGIPEWKEKRAQRAGVYDSTPLFITLSPTQACNLQCTGCYAGSATGKKPTLSFDTVNKILSQKKELWGSFFTTISGGEPMVYRDGDKTILDVFENNHDQFFLMYTNGTLINKDAARRMAELGNVTPAISVEGFEEETDGRRGKGVYKKILQAMENLREAGVMFGISMTATKDNADLLLSPEMIDFWMDRQGASYAWMFQYMPIGRQQSLEMMVPPEKRVELYERARDLIYKDRRFIVDFWNNGPLSRGCISGGRDWGYFYIDWNGNAAPCVFAPYYNENVLEAFAQGRTLDDVRECDLFKGIRQWQHEYGYGKPMKDVENWIAPCPVRDNHDCFCQIREQAGAEPMDEYAELAMEDEDYKKGLTDYGKKIKSLTNDIWKKHYVRTEADKETS